MIYPIKQNRKMEEQEALTPTQQLLIAKIGLVEELLDTLEKIALVDIEGEELDDSEVELQLADGTVKTVAVSAENSLLILREMEKRYGKKLAELYATQRR